MSPNPTPTPNTSPQAVAGEAVAAAARAKLQGELAAAARAMAAAAQPTQAMKAALDAAAASVAALNAADEKRNLAVKAAADAARAAEEAERQRAKGLRDALTHLDQVAQRAAASLAGPMQVLQSGIAAVQSQVVAFVGKLSPLYVQRFAAAVDDLQASIGKALLPLLERFTQVARAVGSVFNGLSGDGQKVVQMLAAGTVGLVAFGAAAAVVTAVLTGGIAPLLAGIAGALGGVAFVSADLKPVLDQVAAVFGGVIDQVGAALAQLDAAGALAGVLSAVAKVIGGQVAAFSSVFASFAPVLNVVFGLIGEIVPAVARFGATLAALQLKVLLAPVVLAGTALSNVLQAVQPYLLAFARVLAEVVDWVSSAVTRLLSLIGIDLAAPEGAPKDSTGMAARQASTGDVNSVLRQARENAYGAGGAADPAKKTAAAAEEMNRKVGEIVAAIKAFPDTLWKKLGELPPEIGKALMGWAGGQLGGAVSSAGGAAAAAATAVSPAASLGAAAGRFLRDAFK